MRKLALGLAMTASIACASAASAAGADGVVSENSALAVEESSVSVTGAAASQAAEPSSPGESGWVFAVTPYLWASGVSGDVQLAQGEEIEIDTSFTDILSDLKFAFMGAMEARNGRLVLLGDIIYLSIGSDAEGPLGFVDADVDMKTFVATGLIGYRVVDDAGTSVDLLAGGRYTSISADVVLTGPLLTRERDRTKSAFAPVIGARLHTPMGGRWSLGLYGDVGGFGVTADLSWELLGTVQYDVSESWRLSAGYRYFHAQKDKGDFDVDIALHGPIMGFSYRF